MSRIRLLPLLSGCRSEEAPLLGRLWLLAFCLGLSMVLFRTAAEARFLHQFGEAGLPKAYLTSAILSALFVAGYGYLHVRVTRLTAFAILLLIFLAGVALVRLLLFVGEREHMREHVISAGRYLAGAVYLLGALGFWPVATSLLDLRQGKRLFGFLATAEGLAEILGGLAIHFVAPELGVDVLLDVALVTLVAALALAWLTLRGHPANMPPPVVHMEGASRRGVFRVLGDLTSSPYLLLILAGFGLATACWYLLDYAFLAGLSSMSRRPRDLAAWLGPFFAAAAGLSLFAQLLVAPRLLEQAGVRQALPILPLSLAVGVSVALVLGLAGLPMGAFAAIVVTKLAERVLTRGVQVPTMRVLYQTVPTPQRAGFQATVEGAGIIVAGLASLVLMLLREYVAPGGTLMLLALAFVLFAWGWASLVLGRVYLEHLQSRLARRRFKPLRLLTDASPETENVLIHWLQHVDPGEILQALRIAAALPQGPALMSACAELLAHPCPAVRREAILRLAASADRQWAVKVEPLIQQDPAPEVRSAAVMALAALDPSGALDSLVELADGTDESLARAALAGLLRHSGLQELLAAGPRLMAWANSPDIARRVAAAEILGDVARPAFYRPLLALLRDSETAVRRAALAAAAQVQYAPLWPAVCEQLEYPDLRMAAVRTLLRADREALPAVIAAVDSREGGTPRRRLLVRLAWRLGGHEVARELLRWGNSSDLRVRLEALDALISLEHLPSTAEQLGQLEQIENEMRRATEMVAVASELDESVGLVGRALRLEWRWRAEIVLARLDLLQPSPVLRSIRQRLRETRGERGLALEALELLVPGGLGRALVSLLDEMPERSRLERLVQWKPSADHRDLATKLRDLYQDAETSSWTRSCLLYDVGQTLQIEHRGLVELGLQNADPLVRESATWASAKLNQVPG